MRNKNTQYIHCPNCGGLIKQRDWDIVSGGKSIIPNYPYCTECSREYEIEVEYGEVFKIKLTDRFEY